MSDVGRGVGVEGVAEWQSAVEHPLCRRLFPRLCEVAMKELSASIQMRVRGGGGAPVVWLRREGDGSVSLVDGYHRREVCLAEGIEPEVRWYEWGEDDEGGDERLASWLLGQNLQRRHQSAEQRAMSVIRTCEWRGGGRPRKGDSEGSLGESNEAMALRANVDVRTIQHAKQAEQAGLGDGVVSGQLGRREVGLILSLGVEEEAIGWIRHGSSREEIVLMLKEHSKEARARKRDLKKSVESTLGKREASLATELAQKDSALMTSHAHVEELQKELDRFRVRCEVLEASADKGTLERIDRYEEQLQAVYAKNTELGEELVSLRRAKGRLERICRDAGIDPRKV